MADTVRCKLICDEVGAAMGTTAEGKLRVMYRARFAPSPEECKENLIFFAGSPAGRVEFTVVAEKFFEAGQHYYADFTAAE